MTIAPTDLASLTEVDGVAVAQHYGDWQAEYRALREHAARFDLSGAGLVEVSGENAYDLVQGALARDLEFVTPEQSLISALLDDDGHPVDVVTTYLDGKAFRLETSIGGGPGVVAHLNALATRAGLDVTVELSTAGKTIILVEGPQAAKILGARIHRDVPAMPLMGVRQGELGGVPVTVVRSGFTGEYGYKLLVAQTDAPTVWAALEDLAAAGLQALETAMLEVRQPVRRLELPAEGDALQLGWAWLVDVTKEDYVGQPALMAAFEAGTRAETVGFTLEGEDAAVAGAAVELGEETVGTVLHSVFSPGLGKVLGLARIEPELVAPDQEFTVEGRTATTLVAPYVTPASWARAK